VGTDRIGQPEELAVIHPEPGPDGPDLVLKRVGPIDEIRHALEKGGDSAMSNPDQ